MRSVLIMGMIAFAFVLTNPGFAQDVETKIFKNKGGDTMPYRLLKPDNYDPKKKYPLVLCFHGAGGRGTDNKSRGTQAFNVLSQTENREKFPAFLLTPQCPKNKKWVNIVWKDGSYSFDKVKISKELELVLEILDSIRKEYSIDDSRLYVTGQSMGGYGTWDIILRNPDLFAAAIPVCGAGDPNQAKKVTKMAIWVFHGDKDPIVPTKGSQDMVKALKAAGNDVKYNEYKDVGHGSWQPAWKEKDLIPWLFKQQKK